jgi:glycosyltransferase involved in cell wall biosynthesis
MLRTLFEFSQQSGEDEFVVFAFDPEHPVLTRLKGSRWEVKRWGGTPWQNRMDTFLRMVGEGPHRDALRWLRRRLQRVRGQDGMGMLRRLVGEGPHREAWRWLRRRFHRHRTPAGGSAEAPKSDFEMQFPENIDIVHYRPELNLWFRGHGIELMVYTSPHPFAFESGIPFVTVIHDLQHLVHPDCPEVTMQKGEGKFREYYLRHGARLATLVLSDSDVGKEDILHYYGRYGVTADNIRVLPFLPPSYLAADVTPQERQRVRTKYRLPDRYLFYPAQFWPYKNHARIVQALGLLRREHGLIAAAVFSGSHSNPLREATFKEVMTQAQESGVNEQVHYLGYAPEEDMSALYAEAEALIMPTFLGPTNIPPLEAWYCGCSVITSNIRGMREQMGDAALLVDPNSVESIAQAIGSLWRDRALRQEMIARGRQRIASYTLADYVSRLRGALDEAKDRVRQGRQSGQRNGSTNEVPVPSACSPSCEQVLS